MKTIPLLILSILPLAAAAAEPQVKLAGVQHVSDDGEEEFDGFKTFNTQKGTNVALIIRSSDKAMVGFDEDEAKLTIGGAAAKCSFFANMAFAKDRKALRLEFNTQDKVKTAPDGTFKVAGELPIVLATGKEETRSEPFTVAKGASVKFPAGKTGLPALKVKSSGKPKWGDDPFEIEFSTDRKADEFAGVRFFTKDGKELESDRGSSGWMSFGGKGSGEITYTFKAPQQELIIAVETWTGREEKKLKVDLSAGLTAP